MSRSTNERRALVVLLFIVLTAGLQAESIIVAPLTQTPPLYAKWAHAHWVWLRGGSNQSDNLKFVEEWAAHDIEVGALNIDSGWATGFNTLEFDTRKFPDASGMIDEMHAQGIKVIVWVTGMINVDAPNYDYATNRSYFLRSALTGEQHRPISWWHGVGRHIDFLNPAAKSWWRESADKLLSLGVDGFKCDGADHYMLEIVAPINSATNDRLSYREYADAYYGSFYEAAREERDGLVMSRPVDCLNEAWWPDLLPEPCLAFSPRNVVWSGWVGDEDPNFDGLASALRKMRRSSLRGYVNFGSDIGGYRSGGAQNPWPLGRSRELFVRWAQLSAFTPLMENGGNNEHRPWRFDELEGSGTTEVTDIYRALVDVHHQLAPYLESSAEHAWGASLAVGGSVMRFLHSADEDYRGNFSTTRDSPAARLDFFLGKAIYVSPITCNASTEPTKTVVLPGVPGDGAWANVLDPMLVADSGAYLSIDTRELGTFPAFQRSGVIVAKRVRVECQ